MVAAAIGRTRQIHLRFASFRVKLNMAYFSHFFAFILLFSTLSGCRKPDCLIPAAELSDEEISGAEPLYEIVRLHKQPVFPGGEANLLFFLHKHVKYAPLCSEQIGVSAISFEILVDGSVSDLKILKLGHPCLEPMIDEMFAQMPVWTPGELNGKPVRTRMVLPIRVCLQ